MAEELKSFPLKIVTPEGIILADQARELVVRAITGELGILAGHTDCIAPLRRSRVMVRLEGEKRYAACAGGLVHVKTGQVTLIARGVEWE